MFKELKTECEKAFSYLDSEFGYTLFSSKASNRGFHVCFKSAIVGVHIAYVIGSPLSVDLLVLEDGSFPAKPAELTPSTEICQFDLLDVEAVLGVSSPPRGNMDFAIPTRAVLDQYAARLRRCGAMLKGELTIIPALQARILQRARAAAYDKWGIRASEYGW